jgi:aminoglycoside 6'-N-acetyltransferase
MKLREHSITLNGDTVLLRPTRETDWEILLAWNSDPELLYFSEGNDVTSYTLEEIQGIYRDVSQTGFCFIIELDGKPIGECWLQRMNLERLLVKYVGQDCRRIDLIIGEKGQWGHGYGTDAIRTLTKFGFEGEHADMIFGCGIADYNERSQRAFQKAGYRVDAKIEEAPGSKAHYSYDLVLTKDEFRQNQE